MLSFVMCFFALSFFALEPAYAEGGGEGGAAGYIKVDSFTVNLQGGDHYLQVGMSLKGATPEIAASVVMRMPMVRHALILVLSSQDADDIRTSQGKIDLMEEIKVAVNKVIDKKGHNGITDVLFENFVIQ